MRTTRRRLVLATGALLGASLAKAQPALRRMAWFGAGRAGTPSPFLDAMRAGLRDLGWEEGHNFALTPFWTDGTPEEAERRARQMIASNPEIIVAYGRDVIAVHRARPPCPVVFAFSGDPVDAGFVQSFARPGTNFTGMSFMSLELAGKRVELLREIVPAIRRLAVLARPEHPGEPRERAVSEAIARELKIAVAYVPIQGASGLEGALKAVGEQHCDALVAFPDAVMLARSERIARFAREARIATVSGWGGFADNGFLLSFGPNLQESYRALARYADRVLRGTRPDQLPVEFPRNVELVLNLRTARALGVTIPQTILLRASRVIE